MDFTNAIGKKIGYVFLFLIFLLLGALIMGLPVMWLWNYVCPSMFGLQVIDFQHAFALNMLCGILFGHSEKSDIKDIKKEQ